MHWNIRELAVGQKLAIGGGVLLLFLSSACASDGESQVDLTPTQSIAQEEVPAVTGDPTPAQSDFGSQEAAADSSAEASDDGSAAVASPDEGDSRDEESRLETVAEPTEDPSNQTEEAANPTENTPVPANDEIQVTEYDVSTANPAQMAPENVLREISFVTGAGGGMCEGMFPSPIILIRDDIELHESILVGLCGWAAGELVKMVVILPDGQTITEEAVSSEQGGNIEIALKTHVLRDPPGEYIVTFTGESGTIAEAFEVQAPDGPRLYWELDVDLLLYNFEPGESVQLFVYAGAGQQASSSGQASYSLSGWQQYQVDAAGQLKIQYKANAGWLAVIGEISGEVMPSYLSSEHLFGIGGISISAEFETATPEIWPISDTNDEACHLTLGDYVLVTDNARLWSAPNVISGERMAALSPGSATVITDGPIWGRIRADIDASGWWWGVTSSTQGISGWIWEVRIDGCD